MLTLQDIDRIIQMAWEDRTPFEAIEAQFGLKEKEVIATMRTHMKRSSFEMWRSNCPKTHFSPDSGSGRTSRKRKWRRREANLFGCGRG